MPLIVILTLTAIKDAIEDWGRTVLDNELNNAPVHRLVDWENVNTQGDTVSLWRRFKKANTRGIIWLYRSMKKTNKKNATGQKDQAMDRKIAEAERRASVVTARTGDEPFETGDGDELPIVGETCASSISITQLRDGPANVGP